MALTRRRMIAISAAFFAAAPIARASSAGTIHHWTGQALGARASIRIDHPDAEAIVGRVMSEIDRLENILSLYRSDSALSKLNRQGYLDTPPFELLECLSLADAVHRASNGRFDPTVQPLWALWAEAAARGSKPTAEAIEAVRRNIGWDKVSIQATTIAMEPGVALTLNGIGQGYVADRIAGLLEAAGLDDILIDTGELRAIGGKPGGGDWPVRMETGEQLLLRQRALATSAPLGTTFDQDGQDGHILDPATGMPTTASLRSVAISAPSAAIADAVATAACLMPGRDAIQDTLRHFDGARLESYA